MKGDLSTTATPSLEMTEKGLLGRTGEKHGEEQEKPRNERLGIVIWCSVINDDTLEEPLFLDSPHAKESISKGIIRCFLVDFKHTALFFYAILEQL